MQRLQQGDLQALEVLVDRYRQPVISFVYRSLLDATEAEDIAQNVFLQVYRSANRYRPSAKFTTWLFTIARNLALNEIRRRSRHPTEALECLDPALERETAHEIKGDPHAEPDRLALTTELNRKLDEAIASLPEAQRSAILLCQQEDLAYEDIAEILGCSLSATKSLIFRARETLKQRLKPFLRTGLWESSDTDAG